jgi:predicted ATP-grasp superfamily ATP-dependent carboligase
VRKPVSSSYKRVVENNVHVVGISDRRLQFFGDKFVPSGETDQLVDFFETVSMEMEKRHVINPSSSEIYQADVSFCRKSDYRLMTIPALRDMPAASVTYIFFHNLNLCLSVVW